MWKRALWTLVPLLGLLELGAHLVDARRAPGEAQWSEAADGIRALRTDHELVVVAPQWAEPWARHVLGDELMPLADVARPDVSAYPRAIEVSILGEQAQELDGWTVKREERHGKFRFRVLENPNPAHVLFDFVDALDPEHAQVTAGARSCSWTEHARVQSGGLGGTPTMPAKRFACGGTSVAVTVIDDERFRPRRCIWAPPVSEGPLTLRFANVPVGARIQGYTGAPWLLTRDGSGPPTLLEVRVAGRSIGTHRQEDGAGWTPFSFNTGASAKERADVELVVTSENTQNHMFCFYADTR